MLLELRSPELVALILPTVLSLVSHQAASDYVEVTLPALRPLLSSASGEPLLLLLQAAPALVGPAPPEVAAQVLPPLLVRGMAAGDAAAQEVALRQVGALSSSLDYVALRGTLLPAISALCLSTTSASVRVSAFAALSRVVPRLGNGDPRDGESLLSTIASVTAVDASPPTAMCAVALGAVIARQWGVALAARRVIPVLAPLLAAPALDAAQFSTCMRTMREILDAIEVSHAARHGTQPATAAPNRVPSGAASAAATDAADWLAATSTAPDMRPGGGAALRSASSSAASTPRSAVGAARGQQASGAGRGRCALQLHNSARTAATAALPTTLSDRDVALVAGLSRTSDGAAPMRPAAMAGHRGRAPGRSSQPASAGGAASALPSRHTAPAVDPFAMTGLSATISGQRAHVARSAGTMEFGTFPSSTAPPGTAGGAADPFALHPSNHLAPDDSAGDLFSTLSSADGKRAHSTSLI